ncbi:MAG: selenocysteine-specific translation elongation factor [Hydrogenobacter sp.]
MKYVTLATAGHVDHGKTSLIKALTNIDTDRLPQEKERGMSIDIGFAFIDYPQINTRVEIIDIPGHERFLKNAIAGLSSAQGVLLVIDTNEGIMPQTIQHVNLMKSFGIYHCLVVLTKIDRSDPMLVQIVKEYVEEFLSKEGVMCFGFFPVSSTEGTGLEELREGIGSYVRDLKEPDWDAFFRMNIDSAFHVKGYGTVVRGSCISGRLKEGDTLIAEPIGIEGKVRRIQNHGKFVKEGKAGERLALNIPEMDTKLIERGFWLVKKGELMKTKFLLISTKDIKPGKEYVFFFGMRGVSGIAKHIQDDIYAIKLSQFVICAREDKGPILDTSGRYVGSYTLVHPHPKKFSKNFIKRHITLLKEDLVNYQIIEGGLKGVNLKEISASLGKAINPQHLHGVRIGMFIYSAHIIGELRNKLVQLLEMHKGMMRLAEAKSKLRVSDEVLSYLLKETRGYTVVEGYIINEKKADIEALESFKKLIQAMKDGIKEERELIAFKDILSLAVRKGYVHSLGEFLYISDTLFNEFVNKLRQLGETFNIQQAKEKLGLTRKYLIPLLEYMDRKGLTVREEQVRRFLR